MPEVTGKRRAKLEARWNKSKTRIAVLTRRESAKDTHPGKPEVGGLLELDMRLGNW